MEVEFGAPITVSALSLQVATEKSGPALTEVWAWDVNRRFFPLHLFAGPVADGAELSTQLDQPVSNVVKLRVATTSASSPIGWREIVVLDR